MSWILFVWLSAQATPAESEALRSTSPLYLTRDTAVAHLVSARLAAREFGVSEYTLLSVAHHESYYIPSVRTPEPGGRVSCGVMTPVPKSRCSVTELTILGGYRAGAAHLREWIDVCHAKDHWRHDVDDEKIQTCALWGYAGGSGFHGSCARHWRRGCEAVRQFIERRDTIQRAVESAT